MMDRDIQRLIRQDAQDQWRSLLQCSDHATNPKRYWSLLRKLGGGARGRTPHLTSQSPSMEKPTPARRRSHEPSTASSAQQDLAIRRLMRNIHHYHRVDPFDKRGVAAAIRKAGSSTAQGPDGLSMLPLRHLGPHGLAFLTELFNLSVAGINITAIWKSSVIILILKAEKPHEQGRSYRPISLLCPAFKILKRLILPAIVEALGTRLSQHGFKPRHSIALALLLISARVVSGFNQRKPPSRTIPIAVGISKG